MPDESIIDNKTIYSHKAFGLQNENKKEGNYI